MRDPEGPEHQIEQAKDIFDQFIKYCDTQTLTKNGNEPYKRVHLVRFTSKAMDIWLKAVLRQIRIFCRELGPDPIPKWRFEMGLSEGNVRLLSALSMSPLTCQI